MLGLTFYLKHKIFDTKNQQLGRVPCKKNRNHCARGLNEFKG